MADESKSGNRPLVHPGVKAFLRFFAYGPSTKAGGLLWGLLSPITFPIWMVCQFIIGCLEILVGELTDNVVIVDGGGSGDGLFDEVSTRRREDLQYLLGIGKYSKEKW